jgi:hypothetical protein
MVPQKEGTTVISPARAECNSVDTARRGFPSSDLSIADSCRWACRPTKVVGKARPELVACALCGKEGACGVCGLARDSRDMELR